MKRKSLVFSGIAVLLIAGAASAAPAAEVAQQVATDCGGCHQLQGPANETLENRRQRKGPPLFYAGNKFHQEWLVNWLQNPTRIRLAGDFPPAHVKQTADGEVFDPASLLNHPSLDAGAAEEVAAYLSGLRPHDALTAQESYTPGNISERLGAMDFVKFKGCAACHKDTPKYGGISGPELYTAWQRLQPAFITSYIRNPTAWEPRSLMPNKHLNDGAIHKLANYLKVLGKKSGTTK